MGQNKLYIFLFVFMTSCSTIEGVYRWTGNKKSPDNFELALENSGDFRYIGWSDVLGSDTIYGSWKFKSDTLFLEKFKEDTLNWITLNKTSVDTIKDDFLIKLLDENGEYLLGADLFIDQSKKSKVYNKEGYLKLDKIPNTIKVNYLSMNFLLDERDIANNNIISVNINFKEMDLDYFHITSKWLKSANKLIQLNENNMPIKNGVFKKSK